MNSLVYFSPDQHLRVKGGPEEVAERLKGGWASLEQVNGRTTVVNGSAVLYVEGIPEESVYKDRDMVSA